MRRKDSPFLKHIDFVLFTAGYNLYKNRNVVNDFGDIFRSFFVNNAVFRKE